MVNFNSHAHVERDKNGIKNKAMELISTHTLTWSVTHLKFKRKILYIISTHTLTWSVTFKSKCYHSNQKISTHTLTWSVTHTRSFVFAVVKNFNSHAHVERDGSGAKEHTLFEKFQLTRSRGA